MRDNEFTKILGGPGYRVYRQEIDEAAKTLRLWARRKQGKLHAYLVGNGTEGKFQNKSPSRR
jgi:hypothetical protein